MKFRLYSILVALIAFTASCEKVIDIDVKDTDKKYVIEGVVTDQPDGHFVKITRSKNLSENNNFAGITDATVTVSDEDGNTTVFEEEGEGIYKPENFNGVIGKRYTLTVDIEGEKFTAVSTMPQKVLMDTLFITEEFLFGQIRKSANITYTDPAGEGNRYRFVQFIEGVKYEEVFIATDEYSDGNEITEKLRTPSDDDEHQITSGDTVTIHALCIDRPVFDFWYTYLTSGATGGSGTASPANPTTNIQGGALGYFSAHTVQVLEAVAP